MGRTWTRLAVVLAAVLLVACGTAPQGTTGVPGGGAAPAAQAPDPAGGAGGEAAQGGGDAASGDAAGVDAAAPQVTAAPAVGGAGGDVADPPGPSPGEGGSVAPPADEGAAGAPPAAGPAAQGGAGGEPGTTTGAGGLPQAPVQGGGPLGSACRPILQPAIPRAVVEVDAQDGAALPQGVLDHLVGTLAAVADKPAGVEVAAGGVEGGPREWTLEEVRAVADATRNVSQTPEVVALHVLSLAGRPDPSDERIATSIGIAFDATSFVVFPDRVDTLTTLVGGEAILRSVVVHELGHLLCLVNIGMASSIAHEDPANPGHSASRGSVMFHAVETTAVSQIFAGPPPDTFDADDLADLEGLRTGRY